MDAIIFLLILGAGIVAVRAKRPWVVLVAFAVALLATAGLFAYHVTDPLDINL